MLASPRNARPCGPMTSIGPYSMGAEDFGPGGVNMENGLKALRKLQHSCNF